MRRVIRGSRGRRGWGWEAEGRERGYTDDTPRIMVSTRNVGGWRIASFISTNWHGIGVYTSSRESPRMCGVVCRGRKNIQLYMHRQQWDTNTPKAARLKIKSPPYMILILQGGRTCLRSSTVTISVAVGSYIIISSTFPPGPVNKLALSLCAIVSLGPVTTRPNYMRYSILVRMPNHPGVPFHRRRPYACACSLC